jgi:IS4 transposase
VYVVDASDEPVHGSDKADYRLHYAIGLFDLGMKEMALTTTETGEKVSNFKTFGANDIVIGDRVYCSIQGIEYLLGRKSGFLLRFGTRRFHLYNRHGRAVNILGYFKGLKPGGSGEKTLYYEYEGEYKPLRFCVMRKTKEAEQKGLETLRKARMRKHGNKELSKAQVAYNRYVIIATSIDAAPELILDLYRQRWHIELAFKRLKSLFKYHEIPVHVEQSARAWFYGKLLLAALCETWVNKGRFSPSTEKRSGKRVVCVV